LQEASQEEPAQVSLSALADAVAADLRSGIPLGVDGLAITGRDLIRAGHRPGPHFGEVLDMLLKEVQEEPARNQAPWLLQRAEALLTSQIAADRTLPKEEEGSHG
jgi:tRNA nucleotidyltransferase (CCA-adding enzyme)